MGGCRALPGQYTLFVYLALFLWEKPLHSDFWASSEEQLGGFRVQNSWRPFRKRRYKMYLRLFPLRQLELQLVGYLVCDCLWFPLSVFTLTLIMKTITGSSHLYTFFFSHRLYGVASDGEHFRNACCQFREVSGWSSSCPPHPQLQSRPKSWAWAAEGLLSTLCSPFWVNPGISAFANTWFP